MPLPNGLFEMILSSGITGYIILLLAVLCWTGTIKNLGVYKPVGKAFLYLALSFGMLMLGGFKLIIGIICMSRVFACNPTYVYRDIAIDLHLFSIPLLLAVMLGGPLIVLNIISIGRKLEEVAWRLPRATEDTEN